MEPHETFLVSQIQEAHVSDNTFVPSNGFINLNSLLKQNLDTKPVFDRSIFLEINSAMPRPTNEQQITQAVCSNPWLLPSTAEETKNVPLIKHRDNIRNWLKCIDLCPYIPPECSKAVDFFQKLHDSCNSQKIHKKAGKFAYIDPKNIPPISASSENNKIRMLLSLSDAGLLRDASDSVWTHTSPTRDNFLACLGKDDAPKHDDGIEPLTTRMPQVDPRKLAMSMNTLGILNFLSHIESEFGQEVLDLWVDTPLFAFCFSDSQGIFYGGNNL